MMNKMLQSAEAAFILYNNTVGISTEDIGIQHSCTGMESSPTSMDASVHCYIPVNS